MCASISRLARLEHFTSICYAERKSIRRRKREKNRRESIEFGQNSCTLFTNAMDCYGVWLANERLFLSCNCILVQLLSKPNTFLIFTGFVHVSIGDVRLKISNPFADELFFESIVSMIWMNWYWLNQIKITLSVHLFLSSQKCSVHCSHSGKLVNEFTFVYIFDESHKTIETPSKSYFTLLSFDCFEMVEPRWERMEQNNQLCVISPQTAFTNCWHSNFPTMRVSRIFYQRFSGMF